MFYLVEKKRSLLKILSFNMFNKEYFYFYTNNLVSIALFNNYGKVKIRLLFTKLLSANNGFVLLVYAK